MSLTFDIARGFPQGGGGGEREGGRGDPKGLGGGGKGGEGGDGIPVLLGYAL